MKNKWGSPPAHHCPISPFDESFQPATPQKSPICLLGLKRQNKEPRRSHTSRSSQDREQRGERELQRKSFLAGCQLSSDYHMCVRKPHIRERNTQKSRGNNPWNWLRSSRFHQPGCKTELWKDQIVSKAKLKISFMDIKIFSTQLDKFHNT